MAGVPTGRFPSFSAGNSAGKQQGTAVLQARTHAHKHTHSFPLP